MDSHHPLIYLNSSGSCLSFSLDVFFHKLCGVVVLLKRCQMAEEAPYYLQTHLHFSILYLRIYFLFLTCYIPVLIWWTFPGSFWKVRYPSSKESEYVSPGGVGEGTSCVCSSPCFSLLLLRGTMSARKGKVIPEMVWIWEPGGVGRDH